MVGKWELKNRFKIFMSTRPKTKTELPSTPVRFFIFVSRPYLLWVVLAILLVTFASVLSQSFPLFYKWFIEAVEANNLDRALLLGLVYPLAMFIETILWRSSGLLAAKWSVNVMQRTNDELMSYVLGHGHTYFSNRFAGSLLTKVNNVVRAMDSFVQEFIWSILSTTISLLVTFYFLFTVDTKVALLFVLLVAVLLFINRLLIPERKRLSKAAAAATSELRGHMSDIFSNISTVRQFTGIDRELYRVGELSDKWTETQWRAWFNSERNQIINGFILFVFFASMMYVLVNNWGEGVTTTAELVFVIAIISSLVGRLIFIGRAMGHFARTIGEAEEGLSELVVPVDISDIPEAPLLKVADGKIVFEKVNFEYGENKVFKDFSLSIPAGQRVGLVGASGAGKSTFVSLLLRQHDIQSGAIFVDEQNIAEVTQDSLRQEMAIVPQEPLLFHRTIKENIAYGNPHATDEEIIAVAKKAQAHDFISALPQGYDTLVGERGVKLSGGQRQRIAIARAMLKDAPILVLDEATSALDSESEVEIQKALHFLMAGKTVVAIAHRLSTLREMDRIIVMENGSIIEGGTHETLKSAGGTYERLWEHQAGGFVGD